MARSQIRAMNAGIKREVKRFQRFASINREAPLRPRLTRQPRRSKPLDIRTQRMKSSAGFAPAVRKFDLAAPLDGMVLRRSFESGEVAVLGVRLMTIGDMGHLTITVHILEDCHGELQLDQPTPL